jgi:glutamine---fructose-6-phosphate transaminase (isomerizing)
LGNACSIIGYVGTKPCKEFILEGLTRLEYRGYDSAGIALIDKHLFCIRAEGKLENLKRKLASDARDGTIGIGHTRWATHGPAIENNAHPHIDSNGTMAVVHNGIIENHAVLKEQLLELGVAFRSDTDTEVIAHLMRSKLDKNGDLLPALVEVAHALHGSFAFVTCFEEMPDTLVLMRKGSPACIGIGENEMYAASDFLALAGKTEKVVFMPEGSMAILKKDAINLYDTDGNPLTPVVQTLQLNPDLYEKLNHEHYMLKEIYEQRTVIRRLVDHCRTLGDSVWQQLGMTSEEAKGIKRIHLLGCGTSWHAARIAQFFFETFCNIPTYVHLASEFRYMPYFTEEGSLHIAVSQSGETADTLEAVRLINKKKEPVIAITNVSTSSMVRETQGFLPLMAGPEIAVASTKAFAAQVSLLYWLSHRLALEKGLITEMTQAEENLLQAANVLESMIDIHKMAIIAKHGKKYCEAKRFIFLGRHVGYPFAMEAALKLKEISYIFAQGYPAGELKHGSIALIDVETPVMLFSHQDPILYKKLLSNAQEVKARKGHLIAVAFEGQEELINLADEVFIIPPVAPLLEPLAMTGLMQFFVYQIAKDLGCDIDKPRNLAKAVTVE